MYVCLKNMHYINSKMCITGTKLCLAHQIKTITLKILLVHHIENTTGTSHFKYYWYITLKILLVHHIENTTVLLSSIELIIVCIRIMHYIVTAVLIVHCP